MLANDRGMLKRMDIWYCWKQKANNGRYHQDELSLRCRGTPCGDGGKR